MTSQQNPIPGSHKEGLVQYVPTGETQVPVTDSEWIGTRAKVYSKVARTALWLIHESDPLYEYSGECRTYDGVVDFTLDEVLRWWEDLRGKPGMDAGPTGPNYAMDVFTVIEVHRAVLLTQKEWPVTVKLPPESGTDFLDKLNKAKGA